MFNTSFFSLNRPKTTFLNHIMGFINFDKNQLINLEYSLSKEMIRSNRAGSFSCTTIIGCNTRKYHGLLICPQPLLGNTRHVLLSKVDETIIQRDAEFNIGINRYPGTYSPKGHKYVREFTAEIIPMVTYRVGGVVLTKETLFVTGQEKVMIRYTLKEATSPTLLRIKPFLAFRNIHELSKRNIYLDTKYQTIPNGIKARMYDGYSSLHMQFSRSRVEYVHSPDWYNDIEYYHEGERGYDFQEDLYVPGFFEFPIKKGESVVFCAGTEEMKPASISRTFNTEVKNRTPRNSFENALSNSAEQFFYRHGEDTDIVAGYPWYDRIGRFTFIALPGIVLSGVAPKACKDVMDTMVRHMKGGFFPETGRGHQTLYRSADTSLWFIWAMQQCCCKKNDDRQVWDQYGDVIKNILDAYAQGTGCIKMHENKLLFIDPDDSDTTWMNCIAEGKPVTPRYGYVVEVNALWYNAIMFALESAKKVKDKEFINKWEPIAQWLPQIFQKTFWDTQNNCLADFVFEGKQDHSIRPNQIIAASLPYSPLQESMKAQLLDVVIRKLLTPRGLRTLSPENVMYKGRYTGDENTRNNMMHQGTAHPWLLGHFAQAYLGLYQKDGVKFIEDLYHGFEEEMTEAGIGTISEIYEGDPPHQSRGAISFAASVGELLRIAKLIEQYR